jgi:hypothetical protein
MPKSRVEILTYKRELVQRRFVVEVTEKELRHILSGLSSTENVMNLDERDFLDYPDGRGEICTRVELTGAQAEMRRLQEIVGRKLFESSKCIDTVDIYAVPTNVARSGTVTVNSVRTVL